MASAQASLLALPEEILFVEITEKHLDPPSLLSLSLTCKLFSKLETSDLFPEITFTGTYEEIEPRTRHISFYLLLGCLKRSNFSLFRFFVEHYHLKTVFPREDIINLSHEIILRNNFELSDWFLEFESPCDHSGTNDSLLAFTLSGNAKRVEEFITAHEIKVKNIDFAKIGESGSVELLKWAIEREGLRQVQKAVSGAITQGSFLSE